MAMENKYLYYGIGEQIRTQREKAGKSLTEVAVAIGSDKAYLSKVEMGDRLPKLETLAKISDALEINMGSLFQPNHSVSTGSAASQADGLNDFITVRQSRINKLSASQITALQGIIEQTLAMAGV